MTQITVLVHKSGEAVVEVNGVTGPSCKDVTKFLDNALGSIQNDVNKADYYEPETKIEQDVKQ